MPRFSAALCILAILVTACGGASTAGSAGSGGAGTASPAPFAQGERPSVDLKIEGGGAEGAWPADPKAPLAVCQHLADGSWRVQYAAAGPTIDLFVGPHAGEAGHANEFALEIDAHGGYLHMDEAGFRTHDAPGRNHMAVAIEPAQGGTAFVIAGTMPYHAGYDDYGQATIALTARCPG
jgi:hypothetical protein